MGLRHQGRQGERYRQDPPASPDLDPSVKRDLASSRLLADRPAWFKAFFVAGVLGYAVLAELAHRSAYFGWDVRLELNVQGITASGFGRFMHWVSAPGTGWVPLIMVASVGAGFFLARRPIEALILVFGTAIGSGLDALLKMLSDRPRPIDHLVRVMGHFPGDSFPSGHVFFYVEFFGFLLFLLYSARPAPADSPRQRAKNGLWRVPAIGLLWALIATIGLSRVYLGAHWPSDTAGAYLGGGLWLVLMIETYHRLKSRPKSTREP
ncbi:MAG TPA: phosphatase PAP2 family protein [Blastocatellia bacterium]|nr:phosphatase PAP2 family protein [Blastocatellia bacterium]